MKQYVTLQLFACCLCLLLLTAPGVAAPAADLPSPAVLITELQVAGATAGEELIALANAAAVPADVTGWQIRFRNAAAQTPATTLLVTIGSADAPVRIPAGGQLLLHSANVPVPATALQQLYAAGLSAADKTVGLYAPQAGQCQFIAQDAVAWGVGVQGTAVPALRLTGQGLLRLPAAELAGIAPVAMSGCVVPPAGPSTPPASPTPAIPAGPDAPPAPLPTAPTPPPRSDDPEPDIPAEPAPSSPEPALPASPTLPARDVGLYAPQLSELLPNPAKPQTDAADEFVELYNPNDAAYDLSGFRLQTATAKHYAFPAGTLLPPKAFTAFFSRDTQLTLSNTQGQVTLLDPFNRPASESGPYTAAPDGQAWVSAGAAWQWSTSPTPAALNVLHTPVAKAKAAAKAKTVALKTAKAMKAASPKKATGTVKSAHTAAKGTVAPPTPQPAVATTASQPPPFNPLHPAVLVLTGVLALLYGAYEYRHDLANKFQQFRANRSARRAAGPSAEGRGDD